MEIGSAATSASNSSGPLLSALQHNVYIQALITVFAVCFCTRILSAQWYSSVKTSQGRGIAPPTLPYWIPVLKHALSMAYDSTSFIAKSLNKFGDGTPFFIDAAGQTILILLDPEHIKRALRSSKELDPNPFIYEKILGQLMGVPKQAIDFYKSGNEQDYIQTTHIRQHLSGSNLNSLDQRLFTILKCNIEQAFLHTAEDEWLEIPDVYAFFEDHVTRATAETLLGSAIVKSYPNIVSDLWLFIEYTYVFFLGVPRFIIPSAYAARDRLHTHLRTWTRKSEILRNQNAVDTSWDAVSGSSLLQERESLYSEMPGHDEEARAAQTLGLLYGGISFTVPVTFWNFFETVRNPTLQDRIVAKLTAHSNTELSSYDFVKLGLEPLIQSLHAEASRYYSSNLTVREVIVPEFALDEKYIVKKGTTIFISAKYTGQFTPGWIHARPQAVSKPLEEFWPERFITTENGKPERFSDTGLGGSWTSFGGGEHKCPGRHFAKDISIVTLAVLLGEYEFELVDAESARRFNPSLKKIAFGTMTPTGKIAARLRRRKR